jgi:hypothetical protein
LRRKIRTIQAQIKKGVAKAETPWQRKKRKEKTMASIKRIRAKKAKAAPKKEET